MTQQDLEQLSALNKQRDPLQKQLAEQAARLFDLWSKLHPPAYGHHCFEGAELSDDGIRIQYTIRSFNSRDIDEEDTVLPIEHFLSPDWENDARKTIAQREQEKSQRALAEKERTDRAKLAELLKQYPQ